MTHPPRYLCRNETSKDSLRTGSLKLPLDLQFHIKHETTHRFKFLLKCIREKKYFCGCMAVIVAYTLKDCTCREIWTFLPGLVYNFLLLSLFSCCYSCLFVFFILLYFIFITNISCSSEGKATRGNKTRTFIIVERFSR